MADINVSYDKEKKNLKVECECGKPITVATKYGMFCEDLCGEEEARKYEGLIDDLTERLCSFFPKATK